MNRSRIVKDQQVKTPAPKVRVPKKQPQGSARTPQQELWDAWYDLVYED